MRITPASLLAELPRPNGERFIAAFQRGTLEVELYAPRVHDPQTPHKRDEIYVVVSGRGEFVCDGKREPFEPGDLLFVAKGVPHRFDKFTNDLVVWVMFFD